MIQDVETAIKRFFDQGMDDPHDIARSVMGAYSSEWIVDQLYDNLEMVLADRARLMIRRARAVIPAEGAKSLLEKLTGNTIAVRYWVPEHGWRLADDMTSAEWRLVESDYRDRAERNLRWAENCALIAAELDAAGVSCLRELRDLAA